MSLELNSKYPVTQEQINFYNDNGFVYLKEVLSEKEVNYYREIIDEVVRGLTQHDKRTLAQKTPYEREFLQCGHLWRTFPEVRTFTLSPRLGSIAKKLLNTSKVRLWHDQALYKMPGGAATEPHQDIAYWPMIEKNAGTIWLALEDVTIDMGAMYFVPGSHKADLFSYDNIIENAIEGKTDLLKKAKAVLKSRDISYDLKAGDATFHHSLTVHFTGENKTGKVRKGMTVIYFADGVRYDAKSPASDHHCAAGSIDGEPIATIYNPLIL